MLLLPRRALVQQQLPPRKTQLYQTYGPQGSPALIPEAQAASVTLKMGRMDAFSAPSQQYVELLNPHTFAVDVTGYSLGGPAQLTLAPGELCSPAVPGHACERQTLCTAASACMPAHQSSQRESRRAVCA